MGLFGGALLYTHYGFIKRHMMKKIARDKVLDTDTSRDYVYTQWNGVKHFVEEFLEALVPEAVQTSLGRGDGKVRSKRLQ